MENNHAKTPRLTRKRVAGAAVITANDIRNIACSEEKKKKEKKIHKPPVQKRKKTKKIDSDIDSTTHSEPEYIDTDDDIDIEDFGELDLEFEENTA